MSKQCLKCGATVAGLANYGRDDSPLCYQCANSQIQCESCNSPIKLADAVMHNSKRLCTKCAQAVAELEEEQVEKLSETTDVEEPTSTTPPVDSQSQETRKQGFWKSLTTTPKSVNEAVTVLRDTAKVWYVLAVIQAAIYSFLFMANSASLSFLGDILIYVAAAFFLPRSKSRTLAVLMVIVAAISLATTLAARVGASSGGRNIFLAFIVAAVSFKAARAAFAYHKYAKTVVVWKNVAITWGSYLVLAILLAIGAIVAYASYSSSTGKELSDDLLGALLIVPAIGVTPIFFPLLCRRFPLTRAEKS